jgi:hypothetical protein
LKFGKKKACDFIDLALQAPGGRRELELNPNTSVFGIVQYISGWWCNNHLEK